MPSSRFPASYVQQRLWFLQKTEPSATAYNLTEAFRLSGHLDISALGAAVADLRTRHESLRTRFTESVGSVIQLVDAAPTGKPDPLLVVDLTQEFARNKEHAVTEFVRWATEKPFDLENGPLLRVEVGRLGTTDHVCILAVHHIVCDDWSLRLIFDDLEELYRTRLEGEPVDLAQADLQYVDFTLWEREILSPEQLKNHLKFWSKQVAGAPIVLELPADRPRTSAPFPTAGEWDFNIPATVIEALEKISIKTRSSLFMVLLSAFEAFIARMTSEPDFLIGVPVSGRTQRELDGIVGMFVNTLALRADMRDNPTFEDLLRRTRDSVLSGKEHAELPFERLVEEVNPDRVPGINPLVQVTFQLLEGGPNSLRLHGLHTERISRGQPTTMFDLSLHIVRASSGVSAVFDYSQDLFDEATISQFAESFSILLSALADDPGIKISELPLLDEAGAVRVLSEFGHGRALPVPPGATITTFLDEQIAARKNEVALVDDESQWTFAELGRAVESVAAALHGRGLGRGDHVGLVAGRTVWLPAGILGIIRSGAVVVPLDPDSPPNRLRGMADETGMRLVVTGPGGDAAGALDLPRLELTEIPIGNTAESGDVPSPPQPDDSAYVMFTSGSTGRPKGVSIRHGSLANLFWSHLHGHFSEMVHIAGQDRLNVAYTTSPAFDAAWDQLLWMVAGHRLVVIGDEGRRDTHLLAERLRAQLVDVLEATPSQVEALVKVGVLDGEKGPSLFLLGGEPVRASLWERLATEPNIHAVNLYGPTEFTVDALTAWIKDSPRPLLGQPVANCQALILDGAGHPVPPGIIGEIHLTGPQLATGYINDPAQTAERFIANPHTTTNNPTHTRMYRTGDLGRFTQNGNIEFHGRNDRQIKIRGYRIEPGEIETALLTHPAVHDAIITTHTNHQKLTAYVAADGDLQPATLRTHLAKLLPDYMTPAAILCMERLPRGVSGKIMESELPEPDESSTGADHIPPREGPERVLAELFADVLGAGPVGRHSDFFRLGGHSLSAVQLTSRIRTIFQTEVSLRQLFAHPTIAELAGLLYKGTAVNRPIPTFDKAAPAPLSFAQQRLWFLQEANPTSVAYNMVESFHLTGPLAVDALAEAFKLVVHRHESLRTRYVAGAELPVQLIDPDWRPEIELTDLSALTAADRLHGTERIVQEVAGRPYDLANGPIFDVRLIRLGPADHVLAFGMHHIAGDGWSVRVLLRDLSAFYRALVTGRRPELPALTTSYAEYAAWERDTFAGEDSLPYWLEQLSGAQLTFNAPTDRDRPAVQSGNGGVIRFRIPADVTEKLTRLGHRHRTTLFTTSLAAYYVLLARWSGQRDILVGVPIAGRSRTEIEGLVGFFVNLVAVRGNLHADPTFDDLLVQVRDTTLGAHAHQELPFERLVEAINPDRGLEANPIVQVTCQLFEEGMASGLELDGISAGHFAADSFSSRFDLSLDLIREGDGIIGEFVYNADLFLPDTIARLADWYKALLSEIVTDAGRRVSTLPLVPAGATAPGHIPWVRGEILPTTGATIIDMFHDQVRRNPERVAVVADSTHWTFADIALAMEEVAESLRGHGVVRGEIVALTMNRSAAMVAALLGVMTTGAAVLPVRPEDPAVWLGHLIAHAEVRVLVTDTPGTSLPALVSHVVPAPTLRRKTGAGFWAPLPSAPPPSPEDTAYVAVVADGPRGVVLPHRALANVVITHEALRRTVLGDADRPLRSVHTAPLGSDVALSQLLWLAAGHELHVVPDRTVEDSAEFLAFTRRNAIDVLPLVPSQVEALVKVGVLDGEKGPSLFLLGGEPVRASLWERLATEPNIHAVNLYGPTEFTVDALTAWIKDSPRPLLGQPVANCQALILDGAGHPVPPGIIGEIHLTGPQLATGYINDPAQTAERFIANPHTTTNNPTHTRMYRTGDLGRFTQNGNIEFHGRNDRQIKIRGYRIEPGEIETALLTHPAVHDAIITTHTNHQNLTAYVVPLEEEHADPREETGAELKQKNIVGSWQAVFEDTHRRAQALDDSEAAAVLGWNDSFTGRAVPVPQMAEWVSTTTDRILSLAPSRVLEIGAGTGLLMRPLCERADLQLYAATDISDPAVETLAALAEEIGHASPGTRVVLGRAEAMEAARRLPDTYDTLLVNSVVQYFPSLRYLERVVEQTLPCLRPGGHIVLGDLRNGALLEAFFSLRQHLRAPAGATQEEVAQSIAQGIHTDGELSVDPGYFGFLLSRHAEITAIEIAPRRGASSNEMNMFRYDAVLHIGCTAKDPQVDWATGEPASLRRIEERLDQEEQPFGYRAVANSRLTEALRLRDTYGFTSPRARRPSDLAGLDPEALWLLGERYGWTTRVSWSNGDPFGTFDVSFVPDSRYPHFVSGEPLDAGQATRRTRPSGAPGNIMPPRAEHALRLSLRDHLSALLPSVMVPQDYVFLDRIERTAGGEPRVPEETVRSRHSSTGPLGQETPAERQSDAAEHSAEHKDDAADVIARILGDRIGLTGPIGRNDDFFTAGGDSLTAAMSVRELRRLGLRLSVRDVFRQKTPAALALRLQQLDEDEQ